MVIGFYQRLALAIKNRQIDERLVPNSSRHFYLVVSALLRKAARTHWMGVLAENGVFEELAREESGTRGFFGLGETGGEVFD